MIYDNFFLSRRQTLAAGRSMFLKNNNYVKENPGTNSPTFQSAMMKKENEIQMGLVARLFMRKGFLIYGKCANI